MSHAAYSIYFTFLTFYLLISFSPLGFKTVFSYPLHFSSLYSSLSKSENLPLITHILVISHCFLCLFHYYSFILWICFLIASLTSSQRVPNLFNSFILIIIFNFKKIFLSTLHWTNCLLAWFCFTYLLFNVF